MKIGVKAPTFGVGSSAQPKPPIEITLPMNVMFTVRSKEAQKKLLRMVADSDTIPLVATIWVQSPLPPSDISFPLSCPSYAAELTSL